MRLGEVRAPIDTRAYTEYRSRPVRWFSWRR
jgi:hypothetical protein